MKKATVTLLTAAGLLALAGCKSEVMQDRSYEPAEPQNDPDVRTTAPMSRRQPARQAQAPVESGRAARPSYQPMSGDYARDGIADDAAPRRRAPGKRGARGGAPAYRDGAPAKGGIYLVKPGDTLGKIAFKNHVSVKALRDANKLDPKRDKFLRVGQKLVIPGGKAAPGGAPCAGPAKGGKKGPAARPANAPKLNADGTYTMVRGDTIPKVARKFGIRAKALQQANNLSDEDTTKLQIGHKLVIPAGADAQVKSAPKARGAAKAKPAAKKKAAPAAAPAAADAAKDDAGANLPPPASDGQTGGGTLMPPPTTDNQVESSNFVPVGEAKTPAEFAAKHNITLEELLKLNPQLDPAAPLESNKMLFVPKK